MVRNRTISVRLLQKCMGNRRSLKLVPMQKHCCRTNRIARTPATMKSAMLLPLSHVQVTPPRFMARMMATMLPIDRTVPT